MTIRAYVCWGSACFCCPDLNDKFKLQSTKSVCVCAVLSFVTVSEYYVYMNNNVDKLREIIIQALLFPCKYLMVIINVGVCNFDGNEIR